jgi:hypothetical protein
MATEKARPADRAIAAVQRYIDTSNAGDIDAMSDCFAAMGVILDGMAPRLRPGRPTGSTASGASRPGRGPRAGPRLRRLVR